MEKILLALVLMMMNFRLLQAQGTFQNLDFESAQLIFTSLQPPTIATTNALPGWTAFGPGRAPGGITITQQLSQIPIGVFSIPTNLNPVALIPAHGGLAVSNTIDGGFSVLLGGGFISQTGQVAADAQFLLFKVFTDELYLPGPVLVSLDGQSLSSLTLLTVPASQNIGYALGYTLYGADISGYAGDSAALTFSGIGILDDIEFSSQPIPEPSALSLVGLGSGVLFCVRKRKRFWS